MSKPRHPSGIDPFELFCVYHLGIGRDGQRRFHNLHHVAQAFDVTPEVIREALVHYEMDPETVLEREFDIAGAQADIAVLPEGMSPVEQARQAYDDYLRSAGSRRDWDRELAEAHDDNEMDPLYRQKRHKER